MRKTTILSVILLSNVSIGMDKLPCQDDVIKLGKTMELYSQSMEKGKNLADQISELKTSVEKTKKELASLESQNFLTRRERRQKKKLMILLEKTKKELADTTKAHITQLFDSVQLESSMEQQKSLVIECLEQN